MFLWFLWFLWFLCQRSMLGSPSEGASIAGEQIMRRAQVLCGINVRADVCDSGVAVVQLVTRCGVRRQLVVNPDATGTADADSDDCCRQPQRSELDDVVFAERLAQNEHSIDAFARCGNRCHAPAAVVPGAEVVEQHVVAVRAQLFLSGVNGVVKTSA